MLSAWFGYERGVKIDGEGIGKGEIICSQIDMVGCVGCLCESHPGRQAQVRQSSCLLRLRHRIASSIFYIPLHEPIIMIHRPLG